MREIRSPIVKSTVIILVLMGGVALMSGCDTACDDPDGGTLQLRSYKVDTDLAGEIATIINEALARGNDEAPAGRATVGPGGRLIVAAPNQVLDAVDEMISDIESDVQSKPTPPPVITITYWVVHGQPAEATAWPPRLGEVAPALDGIASAEGPTQFFLAEKVQLRSLTGERATARTGSYNVEQRATERDGNIFATIELYNHRTGQGGLKTRVKLASDQLLVLGQSGIGEPGTDDASVYFIVRAGFDTASGT